MSHTQVQWARGTSAQAAAYTGPAGEIVIDTDDYSLIVQDGATAGGHTRLAPMTAVPQGRLTLTSNTPVMTADTVGAATVYYTPYIGHWCPVYNGSYMQHLAFGQISLALDSNSANSGYQASGNLYDVFAYNNSGLLALGTGPAWSSSSSRGTGAGTTQLQMLNGIWTNANPLTLHAGVGTSASVATNEATYLGTMYAVANGETSMQFAPAAASGGAAAVLALYNAYNRVGHKSQSADSKASWTNSSSSWGPADASSANSISYVDGLAQSAVDAAYTVAQKTGAGQEIGLIGINLNSISATPAVAALLNNSTNVASQAAVTARFAPALGWNTVTAMESGNSSAAITFYGTGATATGMASGQQTQQLGIGLEM